MYRSRNDDLNYRRERGAKVTTELEAIIRLLTSVRAGWAEASISEGAHYYTAAIEKRFPNGGDRPTKISESGAAKSIPTVQISQGNRACPRAFEKGQFISPAV